MAGLVPAIHVPELDCLKLLALTSLREARRRGNPVLLAALDCFASLAMTTLRPKPLVQYLPQNPAFDGLVGQRRILPPPAVALHFLGGGDETIGGFAAV